jgi:multiple sugar transport system ATP-binding protein
VAEVRLERLSKSFGDIRAVNDLELTIADGEFLVLLGPSGAGKTTTLRLVAGLETPDAGRVLLDGEDATGWHPAERDVAFVFQQFSLYPHYTVYDNLAFPLRAPNRRTPEPEIAKRVTEVAELLRIESKLKNKSTRLSGGEMQRVAIGRALVREPRVFLMDEPMSSLDAKLREELRAELKRIQTRLGATILYVTHDQVEATTLADRIGILEHGRLKQVAPPRTIYDDPDSLGVARRLGSPPINVLKTAWCASSEVPAGADCLGIRPEDLELEVGDPTGHDASPTVTVELVERLGPQHQVVLRNALGEVRVLVPPGVPLARGREVRVRFPIAKRLFFDTAGERIRP